jgi:DNA repair ATPase RecN
MRIADLHIKNFRSHKDTKIPWFAGLNFFAGENNCGKSSIVDAISVAFTGTCRGAWTGRAAGELRTQSGDTKADKKWGLQMNLTGLANREEGDALLIRRAEGQGPQSDVQKALNIELGLDPKAVVCCLYSSALLDMDRKLAQKMLLSIGKGTTVDLDDETMRSISDAGLNAYSRSYDLQACEALYAEAYKERAEAGRALKNEKTSRPVVPEAIAELVADMTTDDLVKSVTQLRQVIQLKRDARQEALSSVQRIEEAPDQLAVKIDEHKEALKHSSTSCSPAVASDIKKRTDSIIGALNKGQQRNKSRAKSVGSLEVQKVELSSEIEVINSQLSEVSTMGTVCKLCNRKLSKDQAKKLEKKLQLDVAKAIEKLEEVEKSLAKLPAAVDIARIERQLAEMEGEEQRYVEARKSIGSLEAKIEKMGKKYNEMTGEMDAKIKTLRGEIVGFESSIEKGEERLTHLTTYAGAMEHYEQVSIGVAALEGKRAALDEVVKLFGPKGPLREQLAAGTGDFAGTLNELLGGLGFDCDLAPLLSLRDDPFVNGRPARMLSESEGLRFGAALAVALAGYTGFGIVALDRFDALQGAARKATFSLLSDFDGQAIVAATLTQTTKEVYIDNAKISAPGLLYCYIDIEDGVSSVTMPETQAQED